MGDSWEQEQASGTEQPVVGERIDGFEKATQGKGYLGMGIPGEESARS